MVSNEVIAELCREHFGEYDGFELREEVREYDDGAKKYIIKISFDGTVLGDRDVMKSLSIKEASNRLFMFIHYEPDTEKFVIQYESYIEHNEED